MNRPQIVITASTPTDELEQIQRLFPAYTITYLLDLFADLEGGVE
jgi:hypothetical protein